jgi:hypothetical protein
VSNKKAITQRKKPLLIEPLEQGGHGPGAGLDHIEQPLRNSHRERSDAISGRGGARRVEIASARDALLAMTRVLRLLKKQRAG